MPLMQIRNFPDDVYKEIARRAEAENRPITQQTVVLLRGALGLAESPKSRRRGALAEAETVRQASPPPPFDPTQAIREDRDR
jgi:plasmid stability protein